MSNFSESVDISERNSAGEAIHVKDTFVSVLLESMRKQWFVADSTIYVPAGNVLPRASKLKGTLTVTLSNAKAAVALADTAARTNIRIIRRIGFLLCIKHLESLFIPIFEETTAPNAKIGFEVKRTKRFLSGNSHGLPLIRPAGRVGNVLRVALRRAL
jgi:hypothetical protein